MVRDDN